MVGSIRLSFLILTCVAAVISANSRAADADPAAPANPGEKARPPAAANAAEFAIPGEDPPQPFVPLHPRTVEDRQRVQALSVYAAARALEDRNQWAEAIDVLEKALKHEPDSVPILRRLCRLCFALRGSEQAEHAEKALKYGKRALQADPDDTDTISRIVSHYLRNDDAAAATEIETVLRGVLANPKLDKHAAGRLLADYDLGQLYAGRLQQPEKAADAFARVLEALDEKDANRLSPKDQKRILGDDPAETYLEFGRVFLQTKRNGLAITAFERGLVYDPDHPELPLRLAETYLNLGKGEEALNLVDRFIKRQPQASDGYELMAKILTVLKRENEITPRLERAAQADSKNLPLQYALADRYRETGQTDKAEALYKQLLNEQPTPAGYGALAASLMKRKKTDDLIKVIVQAMGRPGGLEAIQEQLRTIVKDPAYSAEVIDHGIKLLSAEPPAIDRAAGLRLLGFVGQSTAKLAEEDGGDPAQALTKLVEINRLAIKLSPSANAYRELIDTFRRQGKYVDAAKAVEDLIERYPDERNARVLSYLGELRRLADKKDEAIAAFREALKLAPHDVEAEFGLSRALSQAGKSDEAVQILRDALKNDAANPELNSLLGYVLSQAGKNDEAIALYKGLLEHYPQNDAMVQIARSGLSVVYVNQGDYAKGESELEILLQRTPDDPGVNNDLGYLYADQGKNLEKAESMIRKALQEKPHESAYLDSLGWVLFKRGKAKEALEPLERAVRSSPSGTDATIYEHLGDVYFQLQDYGKAKSAWEHAEKAGAKATPPDKRLPEIRKKLKSLERLGPSPKLSAGKTP